MDEEPGEEGDSNNVQRNVRRFGKVFGAMYYKRE